MAVTAAEFPTGAHAADADSQSDQSGISDVEDELDKLDLQATSARTIPQARCAGCLHVLPDMP